MAQRATKGAERDGHQGEGIQADRIVGAVIQLGRAWRLVLRYLLGVFNRQMDDRRRTDYRSRRMGFIFQTFVLSSGRS